MQVHREGVHEDNFLGPTADQECSRLAQGLFPGVPRRAVEMPFDAEPGPGIEVDLHDVARRAWLQPQRMAAQVDPRLAGPLLGEKETLAESAERIAGVQGEGKGFIGVKIGSEGHTEASCWW